MPRSGCTCGQIFLAKASFQWLSPADLSRNMADAKKGTPGAEGAAESGRAPNVGTGRSARTPSSGKHQTRAKNQPGGQNIPADEELRASIEEALDTLRPYLMADGGSVRVLNVTPEMVVELELLGACGTCPMSTMTLRAGIEQTLKRAVPSISRVEAIATRGVA